MLDNYDQLEEFGLIVVERPGTSGCWVSASVRLLYIVVEYLAILLLSVVLGVALSSSLGLLSGKLMKKREPGVRCVRIHHGNVRDLVCCHVLVWHGWVGLLICAQLGWCASGVTMSMSFGIGSLVWLAARCKLLVWYFRLEGCCFGLLVVCLWQCAGRHVLLFFCGRLGGFWCDGDRTDELCS